MNGYDKDRDVSRLDQLKQVEKTIGRKPKELENLPQLPRDLAYLWQLFGELKTPGVDLSFGELKAYTDLTGEILTGFDVRVLRRLDYFYKAAFR